MANKVTVQHTPSGWQSILKAMRPRQTVYFTNTPDNKPLNRGRKAIKTYRKNTINPSAIFSTKKYAALGVFTIQRIK